VPASPPLSLSPRLIELQERAILAASRTFLGFGKKSCEIGEPFSVFYGGMSRPIRYVPETRTLLEVTVRTIQGRLLLRPSAALNEIILGILGRAQETYGVQICAFSFLANHFLCAAPHKKCYGEYPVMRSWSRRLR
jgi:hypothetical protein